MLYSRTIFLATLLLAGGAFAWPTTYPTGTTLHDEKRAADGYALFAPLDRGEGGGSGVLYLIDVRGNVVHRWSLPFAPLHGRLLPNGNVVVIGRHDKAEPGRIGVGKNAIGGVAGWLVEVDWDGKLVSKHVDLAMHHDFDLLPSGNRIYLAWEPVPDALCAKVRGGIKGTEFEGGVMVNDKLVEVDSKGKVVWEWHANDHMDADVDIIGPLYKRQEWFHGNSVTVLSDRNIAITGRSTDALMIVDRNTGRIVTRFGNTAYLDKETGRIEYRTGPQTTGGPHDVREIPAGQPGAGRLTIYDNGTYTSISRVIEIDPKSGEVKWQTPTENIGRKHYSDFAGGAQRLAGGNTFVCDGANGRLFQITTGGEIVWEYVSSFVPSTKYQGAIFKAHFYPPEYCPQFKSLPGTKK